MSYGELLKRVHELEELLGCREVIASLAYTRLHYISNNRPEDANRHQDILNKIIETLKEST